MLLSLPSLSNIAVNNMARQIRKKNGTGIYHVMLRGINRQDIFEDDEDYSQTELHSHVNEGLWCGNTPTLSTDMCLLWSYTEIMNKEKMITDCEATLRPSGRRTDPMIPIEVIDNRGDLSIEEKESLLAGLSVAWYSFNYWRNNVIWQSEINEINEKTNSSLDY